MTASGPSLVAHPLTPDRWADLERLFGPNGASSNCWCAYQRVSGAEFGRGCANGGAGNRALLRALTDEGRRPGILAFRGDEPVGWISAGPRVEFGRLLRSPVTRLAREERGDPTVWSVACLFLPRRSRGQGIARFLLGAAVEAARAAGGRRIEGYPVDTDGRRIESGSAFMGTRDLFEQAGFTVRAEHWKGRPVMSLDL
ncbi:MAG TPA: GNAT family N-acetyltransferase [candidate division Zixibacteria bacterium]|nr:GNAT family N-acetyltransferase [candidate division Zixibacteria bacterium]